MQVQFTSPPGVGLISKSLPNGEPIRGIVINNPSGSWLYVVSERQYVPPYTDGWSMPTSYEQSSISINANVGPAGQVSTIQGDPWTLILYSDPVDLSSGGPIDSFIKGFTPIVSSLLGGGGGIIVPTLANLAGTWIAAIPNHRIRILTISVSYIANGIFPGTNESPLELVLIDSITNNPVQFFGLNVEQRMQAAVFSSGLDLSPSARLDYQTHAYWASAFLVGSITYQVL